MVENTSKVFLNFSYNKKSINQQPFENNIFYCNVNSHDRYQKPSIHKDVKIK